MKHIIIATKGTHTIRYSINTENNKAGKVWLDPVVKNNLNDTRINSLAALVKTMEQINELEKSQTEPVTIYAINLVLDLIKNGTPLFWLNNGGKKMGGEEVDKTELELWDKFYDLYEKNIRRLIFKDHSIASVVKSGRSRYGISADSKNIAAYINTAWDEVEAKTEHMVEEETDCI